MTNNEKGKFAEKLFELECLKRSITYFIPGLENTRIDYLIHYNSAYQKVQIKYVSLTDDKICVSFVKQQNGRVDKDGTQLLKKYTPDEIDLYLVYCPETNKWYKIPMEISLNQRTIVLRVSDTTNNSQSKNVRFAKDYEW